MKILYPNFDKVEEHIKEVHDEWTEDYVNYTHGLLEAQSSDSGRSLCRRIFLCYVLVIAFLIGWKMQGAIEPALFWTLAIGSTLLQFILRLTVYQFKIRPYKERCAEACEALRVNVVEPASDLGWSLDANGFYGHESEKLIEFLKKLKNEHIEEVSIVRNIVNGDYYMRIAERNLVGSYKITNKDWVVDGLETSADFTFMEYMRLK